MAHSLLISCQYSNTYTCSIGVILHGIKMLLLLTRDLCAYVNQQDSVSLF